MEGYIKFNCKWEQKAIQLPDLLFENLQLQRSRLYDLKLIGIYADGIGFGNISAKTDSGFIVTGSSTGQYAELNRTHYALVSDYSFEQNSVVCTGLTKASAESLTHAAIYEALPETAAVVHVHCLWLWRKLLNQYPTTSQEIVYGTPEMAFAVKDLAGRQNPETVKIIVMGGHTEGILAYGKSLEEATSSIINIFNRYTND